MTLNRISIRVWDREPSGLATTGRTGHGMTLTLPTGSHRSRGWVSRLEAVLQVLTGPTRVPVNDLVRMKAGDVTVSNGIATIITSNRTVTIASTADGTCGPCVLARWLHTLDLTVIHGDRPWVVTALIARVPIHAGHGSDECSADVAITAKTKDIPLLMQVDDRGPISPPEQRTGHQPSRPQRRDGSGDRPVAHHSAGSTNNAGSVVPSGRRLVIT